MYDYIKPLLRKCPKNIILHIWTNNTVNDTSRIVLDKLLSLKAFVEKALPDCNICISNLTLRANNAKASLTVNNVNQHLSTLQLDIIDNSNISNARVRGGLHLNSQGMGKLAINFTNKIKNFKRSWQVPGSFHKNFFDCDFYQNSERSCAEVEDSGSSDKPNSFTHNFNDLHEIRLKNPNRLIFAHINSSIITEVIRTVFKPFIFFFYDKNLQVPKSTKKHQKALKNI